ncbi:hypothetical protein VNO77_06226 [Canavalia gladiata]|uniref:Plant bHLH transcription factor ACT-like domain-containing protein n=1 Tax=Canavalia gladiata TaxID=3824 RepID=A0AAN9M7Y1_CANGL
MEESGENSPSYHSNLEGDDVNDLCFDDEEFSDAVDPMTGETDRKESKQELMEKLLSLFATIPGLKKMDNTSILDKASEYVKQLQERVRELEQEIESNSNSNEGATSCEANCNDNYHGWNEDLPEVKVRVLQKDVLVIIHCEKKKGVMLKILSHLENLHLSVVNSSVLRFGKSTLDITIIAQMGDGYKMTVDELVKTLRVAILTQ